MATNGSSMATFAVLLLDMMVGQVPKDFRFEREACCGVRPLECSVGHQRRDLPWIAKEEEGSSRFSLRPGSLRNDHHPSWSVVKSCTRDRDHRNHGTQRDSHHFLWCPRARPLKKPRRKSGAIRIAVPATSQRECPSNGIACSVGDDMRLLVTSNGSIVPE